MATGFSESVFAEKEKIISDMEDEFHRKLKIFSSEVKATMRAAPTETAMRCFEVALVFLTQAFPNVTDSGESSDEDRTGTRTFEDKLSALESKIEDKAKTTEDELKLHGDKRKASEKRLEKSQDRHRKQLDQLQARVTNHGKNLIKTLKTTTSTAQASVPPPTATSSSSQASAGVSPRGPPESLSEKHRFSARVSGDSGSPNIQDIKLLPGGLVLLADWINECVKLFNTQGQHLHSQILDGGPLCLAVMDITSVSGWDVAVSVFGKNKLYILRMSKNRLSVETSLLTYGACRALAVVNARTLAVGYDLFKSGIDLINLSGQVLHRLTSDVYPCFMATTPDRCLVVSTTSDTLVKLRLVDGTEVFNHKVPQIVYPRGITCHQDGSTIVVDRSSNSLHLVSPEGRWVKKLLDFPGASPFSLSSCQDVRVSCSTDDSVIQFNSCLFSQ